MTRNLLIYAGTFVVLAILDFLWLGVVARNWYREGMGSLLADPPNWAAAGAFYLLYPIGLMIFAVLPAQGEWLRAAMLGALFGLFCYGTYDLTNLAVVRGWSLSLSLVDIGWGAAVSAVGALGGTWVLRWQQTV